MNPQDNPHDMAQPMPVPSSEPPVLVPPPQASPVTAQAAVPIADVPQQAASVQPALAEGLQTPAEAADTDVIEREWVIKAKQVVAATRQDPYKQVRELNKIKADYMKKRYDKDIKLADD